MHKHQSDDNGKYFKTNKQMLQCYHYYNADGNKGQHAESSGKK